MCLESSRAVLQRWKLIRHFVRAFCIFIRAAKRGREKRKWLVLGVVDDDGFD